MTLADFKLHDIARFPIVCLRGSGLPPGYGRAWADEMDALLRQGKPFVLIFPDTIENETHEDQKLRTKWLKSNKQALASICRGIFSVEPDKAKRLLKRVQGAVAAKAFGLHLAVVPDVDAAEVLAALVLAGGSLPDAAEEK